MKLIDQSRTWCKSWSRSQWLFVIVLELYFLGMVFASIHLCLSTAKDRDHWKEEYFKHNVYYFPDQYATRTTNNPNKSEQQP